MIGPTRTAIGTGMAPVLLAALLALPAPAAAPEPTVVAGGPAPGGEKAVTDWTPPAPPPLDSLAIEVTPDHPREFIYTDKGAAHLAGEAVGPDTRSYHGFYVAMHELLDGWTLRLEDGTEVGPATAATARVLPDRLERRHVLPGGDEVREDVVLFDRASGLRIRYDGVPPGAFAFAPRLDMRFLWRVGRPAYEVRWQDGVLLAARADEATRGAGLDHPAWLAIAVAGAQDFRPDGRYLDVTYPKGQARRAMDRASPYLPGAVVGRIPPQVPAGRVEAVVAAGATAAEALASVRRLRAEGTELAAARRARLADLVERTAITTGLARDDRALAWARISLDNLLMDQRGAGIYAGFYWFTTYWGRDTFITLPGACLTSGDFATAETILDSFAAWQDRDPASPRQGRLPNFVTVEEVQFAGVDGTWWFVRAVDELWRRSGDDDFARRMAPVAIRAVEGALAHAVDDEGFLTHGDGETWMDAGGEQNPYSPRGNRAVEVQALWHRGLLVAARLAERFGDDIPAGELDQAAAGPAAAAGGSPETGAARAARYRDLAGRLAAGFRRLFWVDGRLVDHLDRDGTPDRQIRPNGLLAILASPTLFSDAERRAVVAQAAERLVRPWGVLSLAEGDPAFHPHHLDLARYYYDEAYHNGDVWLWLSGPFVSALPDSGRGEPPLLEQAFGQTRMLMDEILDEGAVGTLQEIRDGARAAGNDEFGGATSQAWSLAELLRPLVDDYLGLEVDLTADPPRITIAPRLPREWTHLSARTRIGDRECLVEVVRRGQEGQGADGIVATLRLRERPPPTWDVRVRLPGDGLSGPLTPSGGIPGEWPWELGPAETPLMLDE